MVLCSAEMLSSWCWHGDKRSRSEPTLISGNYFSSAPQRPCWKDGRYEERRATRKATPASTWLSADFFFFFMSNYEKKKKITRLKVCWRFSLHSLLWLFVEFRFLFVWNHIGRMLHWIFNLWTKLRLIWRNTELYSQMSVLSTSFYRPCLICVPVNTFWQKKGKE